MGKRDKKLTRRVLEKLPRQPIHNARNWSKADVYVVEWPRGSEQRVVVKDMKARPLWFRLLAGRYGLRREWRALQALRDVPGVPKVIARPDADALVIEFRPGRKTHRLRQKWLEPETALSMSRQVEEIIAAAHARGVTHGDLHDNNILLDDEGQITIVDWATAHCFGPRPRGPQAVTFREWRGLDERAVAKFKVMRAPAAITANQRRLLLKGGSKTYQAVKKLRHVVAKLRGRDDEAVYQWTDAKYRHRLDRYYQPAAQSADDSYDYNLNNQELEKNATDS